MTLKLTTEDGSTPENEKEASTLVEEELSKFELYMCSGAVQGPMRGPLMRVERGILKTYLMAKLNGQLDES